MMKDDRGLAGCKHAMVESKIFAASVQNPKAFQRQRSVSCRLRKVMFPVSVSSREIYKEGNQAETYRRLLGRETIRFNPLATKERH